MTTSTYIPRSNPELRDHYMRLAKDAESKANKRKALLRQRVIHELNLRYPTEMAIGWTEDEREKRVTSVLNQWISGSKATPGDPEWNKHASLNRWYIDQATMYGMAALDDTIKILIGVITREEITR